MGRNLVINGEAMTWVKFGKHIGITNSVPGVSGSQVLFELGLASEEIRVTPKYNHMDLPADDYGRETSPETLWMGAECNVQMTLVHYDPYVLDAIMNESMGGFELGEDPGVLAPIGRPMGANVPMYSSGNHYMSLNILSPVQDMPYRFRTGYLTGPPVEIPLGTSRTLAKLNWRFIPYARPNASGEVYSSGVVLWDRELDRDP